MWGADMSEKDFYLMMKDKIVMMINFDYGKYEVVDELLLPFSLKGRLLKTPEVTDARDKQQIAESMRVSRVNMRAVVEWLSARVLPLSRENAKKIYNLFGFEQAQDEYSKARIAIVCRALSLQDNYWLKIVNDNVMWADVNLCNVHLNEAIAQVSLRGTSLSLQNKKEEALRCPELTGQGAYAKTWIREADVLYLHKTGNNGITESKIEVMVSKLLDNCNVKHLRYEGAELFDGYICKCKCMTNDSRSLLYGMDFIGWCNRLGRSPYLEALKIDADSIYKMHIVDYLIANPDRHGMNWGFFYNCDSMEIEGCHPLYDHNNAFDTEYMRDRNAPSLYVAGKTMRELAKHAMKEVDFYFYKNVTRKDFLTDRQYNEFMLRAKELGVLVKGAVFGE